MLNQSSQCCSLWTLGVLCENTVTLVVSVLFTVVTGGEDTVTSVVLLLLSWVIESVPVLATEYHRLGKNAPTMKPYSSKL